MTFLLIKNKTFKNFILFYAEKFNKQKNKK